MTIIEAVARMEAIGRAGFTISICCGPSGPDNFRWSVHLLSPYGKESETPLAAESFSHAIEIAELEMARL